MLKMRAYYRLFLRSRLKRPTVSNPSYGRLQSSHYTQLVCLAVCRLNLKTGNELKATLFSSCKAGFMMACQWKTFTCINVEQFTCPRSGSVCPLEIRRAIRLRWSCNIDLCSYTRQQANLCIFVAKSRVTQLSKL